jgi:hypothetical protein
MWYARRACNKFDNFVLEFPAGSTPDERGLLLLSVFQLDYHVFERWGNEN